MKATRLAIALSLAAVAPCYAQGRPSTTTMTCRAASDLMRARGEVVLSTGRDLFDRYVRGQSFCGPGETAMATFAPSADNPQCFVGYRCVSTSMDKN